MKKIGTSQHFKGCRSCSEGLAFKAERTEATAGAMAEASGTAMVTSG